MFFEECNTSITTSHKSRATTPSNLQPASKTIRFAFCTSNLWEQMLDFRRDMRFSPKLISSLQDLPQSLSLGINPINNAELCFTQDNIVGDHSCDDTKELRRPKQLSQALVHSVIDVTSLSTDQRMSRQVQAFQDNLRTLIGQFSNGFQFLLVKMFVCPIRALSCHCRQQVWIFTLLLSRRLHPLMQDSRTKRGSTTRQRN